MCLAFNSSHWVLVPLVCLPACGQGLLSTDAGEFSSSSAAASTTEFETETQAETDSESETDFDSDSETGDIGDGDGDGDDEAVWSCPCVDLNAVCTPTTTAMHDCALPNPCGVVNGSAAAAECVLELLITGAPARFAYNISSGLGCGTGYNNWRGWFYILGPEQGLDNECFIDECNNGFDEPPTATPSARTYTIEAPAHFKACLGESAAEMTNCIFSGLTASDPLAECH